jgi:hypothetical protein
LKLFGDQPVEQGRVLEPAAVITLEEIAQDDTARRSDARTEVSVSMRRMA